MFIIKKLFFAEEGQTLVEYALLLLFVAIAAILAVGLLGESAKEFYNDFVEKMSD